MRKYFIQLIVILVLIFNLPYIALSNCEDLPSFNLQSNKLVIPCINVIELGVNTCIKATLSLTVEGESVFFDIEDISWTNQVVPSGEESLITPVFDFENNILDIPYVKVGAGVVEVSLKLITEELFELESAQVTILPSICSSNVASCWMTTEDNGAGAMLACYEFSGSSIFIEGIMSGTCINMSGSAYTPCPEGAVYSCSYDFSQGNKVTLYSYDSHNPLPCSGLGNFLPFSF